jgi:DNA end-binding protein Ku
MWMGTLNFGLVSMPVKLYSAVTRKTVRFNQIHSLDLGRVHQRHVCELDGEEVPVSEIVKGFQIAPDHYVPVEAHELAALEPLFTRTIEIEDFVELAEIDPIYFDHPYHLVPGIGGARSYRLLHRAMVETDKVAVGRIVLRSKERLVSIRPRGEALLMLTMNFAEEVNSTTGLRELGGEAQQPLDEHELDVARRLVSSIAEPFEIEKYRDTFREAVLDLVDRKAAGEPLELGASPGSPPSSPDVGEALEASLQRVLAAAERQHQA